MKAMVIEQFGGADQLKIKDVPTPKPNDDEVQIKVMDAGVNPVDWKIREGSFKEFLPHEFPLILGWDVAGIVTEVGKNVTDLKVGDEVFAYCRKPIVKNGTYAEFICFDAEHVALKPANLTFAQAAGIPLVGLTAWQGLFDIANLKKGQTVLIHAGAGGVGSLAIQLAKSVGAKVYTTARHNHHHYVKHLGADVVIDYSKDDFVEVIKNREGNGLDVVYDCAGGESLQKSFDIIKKGGILISIVEKVNEDRAKQYQIRSANYMVKPNGLQLKKIAEMLSLGQLIVPDIQELPLEDAPKAQETLRQGHTQGKMVLKIGELEKS